MVAAALPLTEARARFRQLVTAFGAMAPDESGAATTERLTDEGLRLVGDLVHAADTLLAALDTDPAAEASDVGELRALTQALRHMAFLVLAEHNPDQA